jgi:predicted transcriptional regulator
MTLMVQLTKNRSRQEIIRDILSTLEIANLARTKVMYRASLSYTQLKYYEDYLGNNDLISMTEQDLWMLTEKGKQYLQACRAADQILNNPTMTATLTARGSSASSE